MRVSIETAQGLTRKMTIAVPSATFEGQFAEHVRKTASQVKLPGFRPGKVPISEVRRRFGPRLREEVASELLQTSLQEAVQEQDIALASRADVEIVKLEAGADFEFTATFEVLPEFELADLNQLMVRQPVAEVAEPDVDAMVQTLREQRVQWHAVDREAREGDRLTVDYSLTVEGEVVTEGTGRSLIVGSAGLLPELDQTVRGMTAGEMRAFPATLPGGAAGDHAHDHDHDHDHAHEHDHDHDDDHDHAHDHDHDHAHDHDRDNAPATLEVDTDPDGDPVPEAVAESATAEAASPTSRQAIGQVTVQAVEESSLPELDDEFYDQFGISAEEDGDPRGERFRTDVRERMTVELGNALREAQRREALAVLGRSHRFDLPQALVDGEVAQERARLEQMLNDVPDELPPVFVAMAEQRVRVQLAVNKIVTSERMTADDQRVRDRIEEISSAYEESARVRTAIYADEDQLAAIEAAVLEEQVVDHILAQAQVEEVPTSYADVMNGRALPELPEEPSAGEREGLAPRTREPSAGEREGLAPRTREPDPSLPDADDDALSSVGELAKTGADVAADLPETTSIDEGPRDAEAGIGGRFRRMFGKRKSGE